MKMLPYVLQLFLGLLAFCALLKHWNDYGKLSQKYGKAVPLRRYLVRLRERRKVRSAGRCPIRQTRYSSKGLGQYTGGVQQDSETEPSVVRSQKNSNLPGQAVPDGSVLVLSNSAILYFPAVRYNIASRRINFVHGNLEFELEFHYDTPTERPVTRDCLNLHRLSSFPGMPSTLIDHHR